MPNQTIDLNIDAMPVGQRIELLGQLWDSLRHEAENSPLTPEQSAEVRRRVALLNAGQLESSPWSEARERLMNRPSRCS